MTGMPVRGVSVLRVMNRNSVTGAAPVWSRDIERNGVMLMKGLIITDWLQSITAPELTRKKNL